MVLKLAIPSRRRVLALPLTPEEYHDSISRWSHITWCASSYNRVLLQCSLLVTRFRDSLFDDLRFIPRVLRDSDIRKNISQPLNIWNSSSFSHHYLYPLRLKIQNQLLLYSKDISSTPHQRWARPNFDESAPVSAVQSGLHPQKRVPILATPSSVKMAAQEGLFSTTPWCTKMSSRLVNRCRLKFTSLDSKNWLHQMTRGGKKIWIHFLPGTLRAIHLWVNASQACPRPSGS